MTLDEELAAVKAEAEAQREQQIREWMGMTATAVKRVYMITPQQGSRRRRKKRPTTGSTETELMFFHAGRYSAGIRDEKAVTAHFALLKGKR